MRAKPAGLLNLAAKGPVMAPYAEDAEHAIAGAARLAKWRYDLRNLGELLGLQRFYIRNEVANPLLYSRVVKLIQRLQ